MQMDLGQSVTSVPGQRSSKTNSRLRRISLLGTHLAQPRGCWGSMNDLNLAEAMQCSLLIMLNRAEAQMLPIIQW